MHIIYEKQALVSDLAGEPTARAGLNEAAQLFGAILDVGRRNGHLDVSELLKACKGLLHLRPDLIGAAYTSMDAGRMWWSYAAQTNRLSQGKLTANLTQDELLTFANMHGKNKEFVQVFGQDMLEISVWNAFVDELRRVAKPASKPTFGHPTVIWPFVAVALREHWECVRRFTPQSIEKAIAWAKNQGDDKVKHLVSSQILQNKVCSSQGTPLTCAVFQASVGQGGSCF